MRDTKNLEPHGVCPASCLSLEERHASVNKTAAIVLNGKFQSCTDEALGITDRAGIYLALSLLLSFCAVNWSDVLNI